MAVMLSTVVALFDITRERAYSYTQMYTCIDGEHGVCVSYLSRLYIFLRRKVNAPVGISLTSAIMEEILSKLLCS